MAAIDPFAAFGDWDDGADDPLGLGLAPTPRGGNGQHGGGRDDGLMSAEPRPSAPAPMALSMAHVGLDSDARPERHALESMFGIDETGPLGDPLAASFGDPLGDPLGDITTADAHADDWRQAFQPKAAPSPVPTMAPLAHVPAASLGPSSVPDLAETVLRPAAPAASDDVAAALAQGLGLPRDQLPVLTPALAGLIGELLRDAVAGTVDMLLARATLKREVQAAATMIATRDNNPLKFSPNVDVALRHLLQPAVSGFLAPRAAMRDAFDDLRAHQVGLVAGIQGASSRVLRRLDPERMAERLRAPSLVDRALPMARKAALWERFVDEYDRLGQDADEAFQAAFAQAFRAAYEEHFETLRQAGR
jgi:type VI secretion system FHA domain protein